MLEGLKFYKCGRISKNSSQLLTSQGLKWCTGHKGIVDIAMFSSPSKSSLCKPCDVKKTVKYHQGAGRKKHNTFRKSPEKVKTLTTGNGNGRYSKNKSLAKFLGRSWTLTKEEYHELIQRMCEYCQFPLNKSGYGLDRLDNTKGYDLNNVVPCCKECNVARNSNFTPDEMKSTVGPAIRAIKLARINV